MSTIITLSSATVFMTLVLLVYTDYLNPIIYQIPDLGTSEGAVLFASVAVVLAIASTIIDMGDKK